MDPLFDIVVTVGVIERRLLALVYVRVRLV
jgi:hypothetical protein